MKSSDRLFNFTSIVALCCLLSSCVVMRSNTKDVLVTEGSKEIVVRATAAYPPEIDNKTQSMALAREAAITLGQTQLLTYILSKKTASKKTLAEAEIPYIKVQQEVRGMIKGAQVVETKYLDDGCQVTLSISKRQVKELLKAN